MITFANSLVPDQARQNVWPDLDPTVVFLKEFFENVYLGKNCRQQKNMQNDPADKEYLTLCPSNLFPLFIL